MRDFKIAGGNCPCAMGTIGGGTSLQGRIAERRFEAGRDRQSQLLSPGLVAGSCMDLS